MYHRTRECDFTVGNFGEKTNKDVFTISSYCPHILTCVHSICSVFRTMYLLSHFNRRQPTVTMLLSGKLSRFSTLPRDWKAAHLYGARPRGKFDVVDVERAIQNQRPRGHFWRGRGGPEKSKEGSDMNSFSKSAEKHQSVQEEMAGVARLTKCQICCFL